MLRSRGCDALGREIEWRVAARRSTHQRQPEGWAKALGGAWEKLKARARVLVEHPFHIVKNIFSNRKLGASRVCWVGAETAPLLDQNDAPR